MDIIKFEGWSGEPVYTVVSASGEAVARCDTREEAQAFIDAGCDTREKAWQYLESLERKAIQERNARAD